MSTPTETALTPTPVTSLSQLSPGARTRARDDYEQRLTSALTREFTDMLAWVRRTTTDAYAPRTAGAISLSAVTTRWQQAVASLGLPPLVEQRLANAPIPQQIWEVVEGIGTLSRMVSHSQAQAPRVLLAAGSDDRQSVIDLFDNLDSIEDVVDLIGNLETLDDWLEALTKPARWETRIAGFARDVATESFNRNTLDAMRAMGVDAKRWVSHHDSRVRPTHLATNGVAMPLEAPFLVGGEWLRYPGDPNGSPAQTANCRCVLAAVTWID